MDGSTSIVCGITPSVRPPPTRSPHRSLGAARHAWRGKASWPGVPERSPCRAVFHRDRRQYAGNNAGLALATRVRRCSRAGRFLPCRQCPHHRNNRRTRQLFNSLAWSSFEIAFRTIECAGFANMPISRPPTHRGFLVNTLVIVDHGTHLHHTP